MMDVYLHGPLAERFGGAHRFDVRTPREAASALAVNHPGFAEAFRATERWAIVVDGDLPDGEIRDGEDAPLLPASTEIHFYPVVEGQASLGALLITALIPSLTGTLAATILGGLLFAGVLFGLSMLFKPKKKEEEEDQPKAENNYAFTGPENVVAQGIPVPLIYGRCMVGSVVISAGIKTDNPAVDTSGHAGTTDEVEDNMASVQTAYILDLLGEGPIKGIHNWPYGVYLDGVQAWNEKTGQLRFPKTSMDQRQGYPNQTRMAGFPWIESEFDVGVLMEYNQPVIRVINNPEVDAVRVTIQIPSLQSVDKDSGIVYGATVLFNMAFYHDGSHYWTTPVSLSGKTGSPYYWNYILNFPPSMRGEWEIRLTRTNPESGETVSDDIYWSSYTERLDDKVFYQHSALIGLIFDAHDFSTLPQRTYDVDGLVINVPTNYQTITGEYFGVWDGTFAKYWTDNPAWVLYDIITNNRYGLGQYCPANLVDKWSFYKAAQWCDGKVPGKDGVLERRWTCNVVINTQAEAFDLLTQLAYIFRGFTYWTNNTLTLVADQPEAVSAQFTNANVRDGTFTYSNSDIKQRHSQILVGWHDLEQLGQGRVAIVEDQDMVTKYGIQPENIQGIGINRESQAIRTGKWELYTQDFEGETVQFTAGLEGTYVMPGAVFQIMDANVGGIRRGGLVKQATATRVTFDSPIMTIAGTGPFFLSCILNAADKTIIQTRQVVTFDSSLPGSYHAWADVTPAFDTAPMADSVFVLAAASLDKTLWRAINVNQTDPDQYQIDAVRHFPEKWDYVEKDKAFSKPDISDLVAVPPPVLNLKLIETMVQLSPISVGVIGTLSWTSNAARFEVVYRKVGQNWTRLATNEHQLVDIPLTKGTWEFSVTPINTLGRRGAAAKLTQEVIALSQRPKTPTGFRVNITNNIAMFRWNPATELDVIIGGYYEMRYSGLTVGATWNASQTILAKIPGTATSAETTSRIGTWFLRVYDIEHNVSASYATIINLEADTGYVGWARICENPTYPGLHQNTYVKQPQRWLTIANAGGGWWDDQLGNMDTWVAPAVDILPIGESGEAPAEGIYYFQQRFDAGGVFSIRLSADILAFPYSDPTDFFDARKTNIDTWLDFDDVEEDLEGKAVLMIRTTNDDPASAGAEWTEWKRFTVSEYTARGFEFACELSAPIGQNIGVETLCVTGDFRKKADEGNDVAYTGIASGNKTVLFNVKFYSVPAVTLTVQNALATDQIQIVSKNSQQFVLSINNPPGTQVNRTFDWHAQGY